MDGRPDPVLEGTRAEDREWLTTLPRTWRQPVADTEITFASASDLARRIRDRQVSATELVDHYLDRIERFDGELNSYVEVLAERARELAAIKDDQTTGGEVDANAAPFHGVPVSIKELSPLEGASFTFATRAAAGNRATFDGASVAALKRAGMIPLGKTNAPELGTVPYTEPELFGPTRNPWHLDHTPGGSSGGAAAALAAGLCPVAHGSDGGGSIRIPASACGLVGLKPSRFRVSNAPLITSFSLDLTTRGVLTRTVEDAARLLDELEGYVPGDPGVAPAHELPFGAAYARAPLPQRVGLLTTPPLAGYAPEVRAGLERMGALLEEAGHELVEVTAPVPEQVVEDFETIWAAQLAGQPFPNDQLEPLNRWLAERGTTATAAEVYAAEFRLGLYTRAITARFHGEFDLLALPVLTELPPRIGARGELSAEGAWQANVDLVGATPIANMTGQPAISLPVHHDEASGLPVGIQLVARYGDELTLLQVGAQLEEQVCWGTRWPDAYTDAPR